MRNTAPRPKPFIAKIYQSATREGRQRAFTMYDSTALYRPRRPQAKSNAIPDQNERGDVGYIVFPDPCCSGV